MKAAEERKLGGARGDRAWCNPGVGEGMLSVPEEKEKTTRRPLEEKMFNASTGVVWARRGLDVTLDVLPLP